MFLQTFLCHSMIKREKGPWLNYLKVVCMKKNVLSVFMLTLDKKIPTLSSTIQVRKFSKPHFLLKRRTLGLGLFCSHLTPMMYSIDLTFYIISCLKINTITWLTLFDIFENIVHFQTWGRLHANVIDYNYNYFGIS